MSARLAAVACAAVCFPAHAWSLFGPDTPEPQWAHIYLTDAAEAARQFKVDDSNCQAAALGKAPPPQPLAAPTHAPAQPPQITVNTAPQRGIDTSIYSRMQPAEPDWDGFQVAMANAANARQVRAARRQFHASCMYSLGWASTPAEAEAARAKILDDYQRQKDAENAQTQALINTIPELADWQKNDPERWAMAIAIDQDLLKSRQYQEMPSRERMLKVVEIVKSVKLSK